MKRKAIAGWLASAAIGFALAWLTKTPYVPPPLPFPPAEQIAVPEPVTFGWVRDPESIAINRDPAKTLQFAETPAGKASLGDEEVFLWRAVRKVAGKSSTWYPNVNQRDVGCCVGCGWKHSADICLAVQVAAGRAEEWKPVSVEVIYGGSRVEVGGGQIRGDGSVGAWAAKWCSSQGGLVPMEKVGGADLTTFDPQRARLYGSKGVPDDVEAVAKVHPVRSTALVKTWSDVKRSIQQGYPVAVCSGQGFSMTRDSNGFARAQGSWPHCMAIIGIRNQPREGGFILNSWGDSAHTGGVYPEDQPIAGFWADASTIDRMVGEGDSFALSDAVGFPARKVPIDWFAEAPRKGEPGMCLVLGTYKGRPFYYRAFDGTPLSP